MKRRPHQILTAVPRTGSRCELSDALSPFSSGLLRVPLEPTVLSLEFAEKSSSTLGLRVAAPHALTFVKMTALPWCEPFRLVRVNIRLSETFKLHELSSEDGASLTETVVDNAEIMATIEMPPIAAPAVDSLALSSRQLPCMVRCCTDSVLIEIPVPAGTTLRPGAGIALSVTIAGSPVALRIPAMGHIHSATCNHSKQPRGRVYDAAEKGDACALEAALAAGCSTEEAQQVR
jgi:hypothetical protein